jgi:hypothetical protein
MSSAADPATPDSFLLAQVDWCDNGTRDLIGAIATPAEQCRPDLPAGSAR